VLKVNDKSFKICRCSRCSVIGDLDSPCPSCHEMIRSYHFAVGEHGDSSLNVYKCAKCSQVKTSPTKICCIGSSNVCISIQNYLDTISKKEEQKDENIASICEKMFDKAKQKISELETYTKEPFLLCPQSDLLMKEMTDFANRLPACTEKSKISEKIKILLELAEKARTMEQLLSIFHVEKMVQFVARGNMDH
jgi:hypothetical protein